MATNSLPGYTNIRANSTVAGNDYSLWFHNDSVNDWHHCKLISRPSCSIMAMEPTDAYIFREYDHEGNLTDREWKLTKNSCFPYFLVTQNIGVTGKKVQTRITIVEKND